MSDCLPYLMDQPFLMPVDLRDWLPEDDIVYFVVDSVGRMDLSPILSRCGRSDPRGRRSYDPRLLINLILYGYVAKVYSSRNLEAATYRRLDFRVLTGDQHPDHDTISSFRKTHLSALAGLFKDVLGLCVTARLVAFESLSIDGTKILANASIRANRTVTSLEAERQRQLEFLGEYAEACGQKALAADAEDDRKDAESRGNEGGQVSAANLRDRKARLAYIDSLLAAQKKEQAERTKATPPKEARINTTDSESRIMRDGATKAFFQAYNAQIAVDAENQIIVAATVTQDANDKKQLVPLVELSQENGGCRPKQALADSGYFSKEQVTDPALAGIDLLVPPDRACTTDPVTDAAAVPAVTKHGGFVAYCAPETAADAMRAKLKTVTGRSDYALRGQTVEPVFGQIKAGAGFRRFLLRGREQVGYEWSLICLASNLKKLYRATVCKPARRSVTVSPKVGRTVYGAGTLTAKPAL